ncbi:hypothetical protein SDC9_153388 [bioreactor metagenome]|uniref:Uncharacterized protein n=1 Tax=bioreactor metagenome TaxID=1076179 RepID=A0A645F0E5_9ZZZZ
MAFTSLSQLQSRKKLTGTGKGSRRLKKDFRLKIERIDQGVRVRKHYTVNKPGRDDERIIHVKVHLAVFIPMNDAPLGNKANLVEVMIMQWPVFGTFGDDVGMVRRICFLQRSKRDDLYGLAVQSLQNGILVFR